MSDQGKSLAAAESKEVSQLNLFEIVENPTATNRYSNTIELYDAFPKYLWTKQREFYDLEKAEIVRFCTVKHQKYKVVIKPAIIRKKSQNVLIYPGPREEFVEDALRKLAVAGQSLMINESAGVSFTLYQLAQELQQMGHTYSLDEIKEAIAVCRGSSLECYTEDGEEVISSNFFPTSALTTKGDYKSKGKDARCFVTFNPLVTRSILALSFRRYNYSLGMQISSALARFLYKRMSHHWTQASEHKPYTPHLVSFLSQSPRGLSARMPENIRAMKDALEVLIDHEVVGNYEANKIFEGKKILDIHYVIYPHEKFVKMIIEANIESKKNQLASIKNIVAKK